MAAKKPRVTKAQASQAASVVEPFLRCGDCDAKLPVDAVKCPKCGYEL